MRWTSQWFSTDETAQRRRRISNDYIFILMIHLFVWTFSVFKCTNTRTTESGCKTVCTPVSGEEPNGTTFHSVGRGFCPKRLTVYHPTHTHITSNLQFLLKDTVKCGFIFRANRSPLYHALLSLLPGNIISLSPITVVFLVVVLW